MIRVAAGITAVILVFVALLYLRYSGDDAPDDAPEGGTPVVVAAQDIAAGVRISEDMVRVVPVPEGEIVSGSFPDAAGVVGKVTRVAIAADEQIAASKVATPVGPAADFGFSPGTRVMSLSIEPMASGQRVRPGDRVDILAANDGAGTAMTLVQNVEVLAISPVSARPGSAEIRETVTVAMDAEQATVLAQAEGHVSTLSLAFHAASD